MNAELQTGGRFRRGQVTKLAQGLENKGGVASSSAAEGARDFPVPASQKPATGRRRAEAALWRAAEESPEPAGWKARARSLSLAPPKGFSPYYIDKKLSFLYTAAASEGLLACLCALSERTSRNNKEQKG